jgi:hypothetical protein
VVHTGEEGKVHKILVGKPEGKRPLGNGGINGIRMALKEIGWRIGFIWLRTGTDSGIL